MCWPAWCKLVMGPRKAVLIVYLFVFVPAHNAHVHCVVSFCNCRHTVMPQRADTVYYVSICHEASVPTSPVNVLSVDLPMSQGGRRRFCSQQQEICSVSCCGDTTGPFE